MTIAGYDFGGPAAYNALITAVGRSADTSNSSVNLDYQIAEQIFKGDSSGARGFNLIKDFGGLSEQEYWEKLMEAGAQINSNPDRIVPCPEILTALSIL